MKFRVTCTLRNNKCAEVHRDFVDQALAEVMTSERVIQLSQHGKKRLTLDLPFINNCYYKKEGKVRRLKSRIYPFQARCEYVLIRIKKRLSSYESIQKHQKDPGDRVSGPYLLSDHTVKLLLVPDMQPVH